MAQEYALFGRRKIFTSAEEITRDNVIEIVNEVISVHTLNMLEMDYLYWYRRGLQPILNRTKEVRPEINNKVVENHADEIVSFKNGYFLTQPAYYISRSDDEKVTEKVKMLNEHLYRCGKLNVDNKVVDWFHTVGIGVLLVEPNDDKDYPVSVYELDPRQAFVVYSKRPGNKPIMGVNVVMKNKNEAVIDVFAKDSYFQLFGGMRADTITNDPVVVTANAVKSEKPNVLKKIPIVEYRYNSVNMGSFESVVPLLDAINDVQSNRIDGIDQFIQSLAVAVNCQFEKGTTANDIRQAGMIVLKSVGENKADFKILSEQLNQSESQILVDYLYQQILTICGMPTTTKGGTSTSDSGAAVLYRDGWYQADTFARNTEDLFKESNRYFDEIFVDILNKKAELDIKLSDFELKIARNETANLLVKTQGALNLKQLGLSPEIALSRSGVSNDPVADVANSKKYIDKAWGTEDANLNIDEVTREDVGVV